MKIRRLAQLRNVYLKTLLLTSAAIAIVMVPLTISGGHSTAWAQDSSESINARIQSHLKYGEFPAAIELVKRLPTQDSDQWLQAIATAQHQAGANAGAFKSIGMISADRARYAVLANLTGPVGSESENSTVGSSDNLVGSNLKAGASGGITEADFDPLIDLIKSTIDIEGWDDTNGDGTIQAYPPGVFVDSTGTLHKLHVDAKHSLKVLKQQSKRDSGNRLAGQPSELRKVSLNRLEKQAQLLAAQGKPIDDVMQNLAGMYEIHYLMLLPETNDIVIVGRAGAWEKDFEGRMINSETGKPTLRLDDLVVCLRNAYREAGKFGCAITPRQKNLAETKKFIEESSLTGKAWRTRLRETLGKQDIEVFGIDSRTHAGHVLVEADYRMKLVAMGLEKTIPEIPSYLDRIQLLPGGGLPPLDVVRWWFTMNYDDVIADEALEAFTFTGTGVKVLSENEMIDDQGGRIHTNQSKGPTAGYARDFTRHFDKIANEYPVYRQLKNLFDLAIVSALIRDQQLDQRAGWHLTFFGESMSYADLTYELSLSDAPKQVDSVMNHRVITERKQSSTLKHTLIGVSGGISFDSMSVVKRDSMKPDSNGKLAKLADGSIPSDDLQNWWWD